MAAGKVNFPHYALSDPLGVITFHDTTDELMPGNAVEARIALQDFPVGSADSRQQNSY
jgi:hypothetical protein